MKYREEKIQDVLVLRVDELRLDSNIASEFKTEMLRLIEQDHIDKILIDMAKVDYTDSSGLGAILFAHRQAANHKGELKLMNLNPKVKTLLQIARLEHVLESYNSEKEALSSF